MAKFFGCSILSFNTRLGSGGSETLLDVELAACTVEGDEFDPVTIGHPALFTYGDFSFYGITDTYKKNDSSSGSPTYSVQLTNGAHIFSGVEIIINDYYGAVTSIPNLVNAFGYLENKDGFGGSGVNNAGMSWAAIATAIDETVNTLPVNDYGRPISYKGKYYKVDLSNLPNIPSYYRINSDNISLYDFVSEVCSAGGHDFFIELRKPNTTEEAAGFSGVFVVKTIDRTTEAVAGAVQSFIDSAECVVSKDFGQEVRKDAHSKFLVGANVERMYFNYPQNTGDDAAPATTSDFYNNTILPYFGRDYYNNVIVGRRPDGYDPNEYFFDIDTKDVKGLSPLYTCSINELRAAKKGRPSWEAFLAKTNCNRYIINPNGGSTDYFLQSGSVASINVSGVYDGIYKYGYLWVRQKYGNAAANSLYTTPQSKLLTYPHNGVSNPYFGRSDLLRLTDGSPIVFARMFESDLYTKAGSNTMAAQAYESFKENFGADVVARAYVGRRMALYGSNYESELVGNHFEKISTQVFKKVKNLADNYFGRKFMVTIPFTLATIEPESTNIRLSQEISNDGYIDEELWPVAYESGLIPNISGINTLLTPENKFYPFVKYNDAVRTNLSTGQIKTVSYDFSEISSDDLIFNPSGTSSDEVVYDAWVKCSVDPDIVFLDSQTLYSPRAVINIPGFIKVNNNTPERISNLKEDLVRFAKANGGAFAADGAITSAFAQKAADKVAADVGQFPVNDNYALANLYSVPLRSKLLSYGPWYAIGADGRVVYERNTDLNPWNYGGFTALTAAANARVQDGITDQTFGEAGSVTVAGAPTVNIGDILISGGPYITDMNCSIGPNGVTTTYNFQTWSAHKNLTKLNNFHNDRVNRISKVTREIKSNFREGLKNGRWKNAGGFYGAVSNRIVDLNDAAKKDRPSTSHTVISAQCNTHENTVAIQPVYNTAAQSYHDYENKAFMSLDGLFRPYSTVAHDKLPVTLESVYNDEKNVNDLFPFGSGNDISFVSYGVDSSDSDEGINTVSYRENYEDLRAIGLKGPLMVAGPGYDIYDKPVPASEEDPNEFAEDYKFNPSTWKAGPVDLRWDEEHGIWRNKVGNPIIVLVDGLAPADDFYANESEIPYSYARYIKKLESGNYEIDNDRDPLKVYNRLQSVGYPAGAIGTWRLVLGVPQFEPIDDMRREALLLEDLVGIDDPLDTPTHATFAFLKEDVNGRLSIQKINGEDFTSTVFHRLSFTIPAGTYIEIEHLNGRWRPYVANCTNESSSSYSFDDAFDEEGRI